MRELSGNEPWQSTAWPTANTWAANYGGELKRARLADIRGLRDHFTPRIGLGRRDRLGRSAWGTYPGWGAWQRRTLPPPRAWALLNVLVARLDDLPFRRPVRGIHA